MADFSVLLSLYAKERPDFLRQSLDSVFSQTARPSEVVLVEDGPLTRELECVVRDYESRFPELKVVKLPENRGLGMALREGMKHCTHALVARMDTDDVCFPTRFERQIEFMERNPEVDVCSSWMEEFCGDVSDVTAVKKVPETHGELAVYIKSRNPMNHPAVVFRKAAVERAGGYMHFPLFEDYYLWARMFGCGCRFHNLQECLLHFRTSPDMYKRRGGWRYAALSARFQFCLRRMGVVSWGQAVKSSMLRAAVYLMPNAVRAMVYKKILR